MSVYNQVKNMGGGETNKNNTVDTNDDDDWETEPDFVNDLSEKEKRYGSKTIPGSGKGDSKDVAQIREKAKEQHQSSANNEYYQKKSLYGVDYETDKAQREGKKNY
eukprot:TRINITY_DN2601_c0_g1_i1.p1 TRINITY_DN2601_c0_g1~~TRINITY_DN2601_c0_g1_i1.p1  ORF type:complete len:106 (-),score=45.64 TRINITY_DN2601_c0_g1_i1:35-352(-)